jgi:hypothetical protein
MTYKILRCDNCNEFFTTTADFTFQCPFCNKQGRFFSINGKDRILKTIHFSFPTEYGAEKFLKYIKTLSPEHLKANYWKLYHHHKISRRKEIQPLDKKIKFKIRRDSAVSPIFKIKKFWVRLTILKINDGFNIITYIKDNSRTVKNTPFIYNCLLYITESFYPIQNYTEFLEWGTKQVK